jgi:hypothetical protein
MATNQRKVFAMDEGDGTMCTPLVSLIGKLPAELPRIPSMAR